MNDSSAFGSRTAYLVFGLAIFLNLSACHPLASVSIADESVPSAEGAGATAETSTIDSEQLPPVDPAVASPQGRSEGLVQSFEKWLDDKSGVAVQVIASVLFWEFTGRQDVTTAVEDLQISETELPQLVQQVSERLSASGQTPVAWNRELMQSNLNAEDLSRFEAAISSIVERLRPGVESLAEELNVEEANLTLTVPEGSMTPEAASLVAESLNSAYTVSPLRNLSIKFSDSESSSSSTSLQGIRSGIPIVVAWLAAGALFFTLRMGFINVRGFWHAIRVTAGRYDDPSDAGEVSHFQALSAALSATVGLGNIGGVAIAIGTGGPGATFWMIVAGFLGMSAKFAECTLGQKYREVRPDGRIMGGAMFYLSKGLAEMNLGALGKLLGVLFAVLCIGASFGGGNAFQVNQAISTVQNTFPVLDNVLAKFCVGVVMAILVGIVIIGGIRRIASTAEKIVPLMCGIYVAACLYILLRHSSEVPAAISLIMSEAFTPRAGYGGFLGVLILGFRRAAFSNEAGVGSAAIAHSAAKTDYPVREGIVALLEPFIDTVVVCTMTALVIVITGAYDLSNPMFAPYIIGNKGAALTSVAMRQEISWFPYVLSCAVLLFAYSTMISWSYYGERCWAYLFGDRTSLIYKCLFILCVVVGAMMNATNVLDLSDLMILGMAFPNVLGVVLLSGKLKRDLDDYWAKLKSGDLDREAESYRVN